MGPKPLDKDIAKRHCRFARFSVLVEGGHIPRRFHSAPLLARSTFLGGTQEKIQCQCQGVSRGEALQKPVSAFFASIPKSVMEAVGPPLPELKAGRRQHITAPMKRSGHWLAGVKCFEFFPFFFQVGPVSHDFALVRSPSGNAAASRPTREISIGFCCR